jgi:hypothetical protein
MNDLYLIFGGAFAIALLSWLILKFLMKEEIIGTTEDLQQSGHNYAK